MDDASVIGSDFSETILRMKGKRKKVESSINAKVLGAQSGLPISTQKELSRWTEMFHLEVHGARFTGFSEDSDWLKGKELLPVCPMPNGLTMANYMNRSSEISWMFLRTLPLLQLEIAAFGQQWSRRWQILDESFKFMIENLRLPTKPVFGAILDFIDRKLGFTPSVTKYPPEA
jgi:hypothetical protein